MKRPVRIVDHDPQWPILFEKEKRRILDVIGHIVVRIEHIGSTAVPNLGAKPTIDIMVAVNHLDNAEQCIKPLQRIGYEYQPKHEVSMPERRFFSKGDPPEQHYHLHMVELTSDFWKRHLLFRDYLRSHPEIAQEYYEMKKALADKYGSDREGYTESKTSFIESVVSKARRGIRGKTEPVKFVVGCNLKEFKEHYERNGWEGELGTGELGTTEEKIVTQDPSHLIVWRENNKIIGHAIWHETNTEEHRRGDSRDTEDREILEKFMGGKKDFVELHEVWLVKEYRGKGYGKKFFEFFEEFVRNRGYDSIIFYAFHPAAIAICRQRGYAEDHLAKEVEYVFYLSPKLK